MSRYDGLIIPRSYNEYISKSAPQELKQALINTGLVPAQASAQNPLTDKEFVNSTVGTNTANYIYKTESGGEKVPFSSIAELEAYSGTVTNNDYAFVTGTDSAGNIYYDRYKANVDGDVVTWAKEYRLNNSSFTAAQWAAIQSGITATKVENLVLKENIDIYTLNEKIIGKWINNDNVYRCVYRNNSEINAAGNNWIETNIDFNNKRPIKGWLIQNGINSYPIIVSGSNPLTFMHTRNTTIDLNTNTLIVIDYIKAITSLSL